MWVEGLGPVGFVGRGDGRVVAVAPWYLVYVMMVTLVYYKDWLSRWLGRVKSRLGLEDEGGLEACLDASNTWPGDPDLEEKIKRCRIEEVLRRECRLNASTYRNLAYASAYALGTARLLSLLARDSGVKVRMAGLLHLVVEAEARSGGEEREAREALSELIKLAVLLPPYLFSCHCQAELVKRLFREAREPELRVYMQSHLGAANDVLEGVAREAVRRGRAKGVEEYLERALSWVSYIVEYTLIDAVIDLVEVARLRAAEKGEKGYRLVAEAAREAAKIVTGACGRQPHIPPRDIVKVMAVEGGLGLKDEYDDIMARRLLLGALAPGTAKLIYEVSPIILSDEKHAATVMKGSERAVICTEGYDDADPILGKPEDDDSSVLP